MSEDKALHVMTDGHATLSLHDATESLGEGSFALTMSDGGGFSSMFTDKDGLKELKEALEKVLGHEDIQGS